MNEEKYLKIEAWLKSIDTQLEKIESTLNNVPSGSSFELITNSHVVEKLAKYLKASEEEVYHIINFEPDGEFTFLFNIDGKNESDKQFEATICLLTVLYYCYGKDEIATTTLKKKLEFLGINALDHLSHSLRKKVKFVVLKGKGGSSKFNYKITQPGLVEGIKLLSKRINTNN